MVFVDCAYIYTKLQIQQQVTKEQQQTQDHQELQPQGPKSSHAVLKRQERDQEEDYYCMFIVIVLSKIHIGNNVYV